MDRVTRENLETIEISGKSVPSGFFVLLIALSVLSAGSFYFSQSSLSFLVAIFLFWIAIFLLRPQAISKKTFFFNESELVFKEEDQEEKVLLYENIQGYRHGNKTAVSSEFGKRSNGKLELAHQQGIVVIPYVNAEQLSEIRDRINVAIAPTLSRTNSPQELTSFLKKQIELFDEERIYSFKARKHFQPTGMQEQTRLWGLFFTITFSILILGICFQSAEYITTACVGILVGGIALLAGAISRGILVDKAVKGAKGGGLIISPGGFALKQDKLKGILRWDEIIAIELPKKQSWNCALELKIKGGSIILSDFYEVPLKLIHDLIKNYWKQQG